MQMFKYKYLFVVALTDDCQEIWFFCLTLCLFLHVMS